MGDFTRFLDKKLDGWLDGLVGARKASGRHTTEYDYFAGLGYARVRRYDDIPLIVAVGFNPYATSEWCGGSVVMAAVSGKDLDDETFNQMFDSVRIDAEPIRLPKLGEHYDSGAFSVSIPHGWDAAARPEGAVGSAFNARECGSGTNVIISEEPLAGQTLHGFVEATLADYRVEKEFPGFTLLTRTKAHVKGSRESEEITFKWNSSNGWVWQRQTYATDGRDLLYMTFTAYASNAGDPASNTFAESVAMGGG